jgi:hypothetical protein
MDKLNDLIKGKVVLHFMHVFMVYLFHGLWQDAGFSLETQIPSHGSPYEGSGG